MHDKSNKVEKTSQEVQQIEFISIENKLKKFGLTYGLLLITIALFIIFSFIQPRFASQRNIFNLLAQGSIIGMLALGLTNVIISGNFDISFAANATINSIICAILVSEYKVPLLLAYLIVMAIAMIISLTNGIIIVYLGIPSFIATLSMSTILYGFSKWITAGSILVFPNLPYTFKILGKGKIGGVFPVILLVFIILTFMEIYYLELSYKGRHFYSVGSNLQAAVRVGININKIKFEAFVLMGVIAGIASLAIGSLFELANPDMAESFLFPTIIVGLLGAVFFKEGIPNVLGTVVAAVLMAVITNGFTILGIPLWIKEIAQGLILTIAIILISALKPGGIPPVVLKRY